MNHFGGDINVKVDLSNYATKDDIKNITHVDSSSFALKTNVANLKTKVDKLDIDNLKSVPTDLSKLSDVVKNDAVKKTDYNKLVTKVDNIDTSGLVKKTDYNTKITEIEDKIPDTSSLATKSALTTVENKIPYVSNLVKKTDYNTKITDIENKLNNHDHDKYINTSEFNKLAADIFNARIVQANLITKTDFDAKLSSLNIKVTNNKSKHLLAENELNKLKTFDSSYFHGKNYFDEDGNQNYYIFQPISKYLKVIYVNDINYVLSWKSRGLNEAKIESIKTNNYSLNPRMDHYDMSKIRIQFDGSFLNRFPPTILQGNIVNIYIVYEITSDYKDINYPTLENCLFGSVKLTKNADIDKYGYTGYGIGFHRETSFSFDNDFGKNVIIFGVDMSSSKKIGNRKKDILILGKGPTQGLESTLSAEKCIQLTLLRKIQNFV